MAQSNGKDIASNRTFNCRDLLWEIFERIAKEDGCTVDELINASMQSYASPRAERTPVPQGVAFKDLPNPIGQRPPYRDPTGRSPSQPSFPAVSMPAAVSPPPLPADRSPLMSMAPTPVPAAPAVAPPPLRVPAPPAWGTAPVPHARVEPPPLPVAASPGPAASGYEAPPVPYGYPPGGAAHSDGAPRSAGLPRLFVMVAGERYQVSKERYVIGRGSRSSDLIIRDPNVSRQHAMVELSDGRFYMVDMGSVNGVEHNGNRIARKAIENGDRFDICGHEIVFSWS
jgi:hypothetical protein